MIFSRPRQNPAVAPDCPSVRVSPAASRSACSATHKPQYSITMKALRVVKNSLGPGSVLALIIGLASSAFAGPGPQFWQQQEKIRAENAAKAKAAAPTATAATKPADTPAMACPTCKTKNFVDVAPPNAANKFALRAVTAGTKHYCASCGGGAITVVQGKATDEMKRDHAACETMACCVPRCDRMRLRGPSMTSHAALSLTLKKQPTRPTRPLRPV